MPQTFKDRTDERPVQTVRVYLKHKSDDSFNPQQAKCEDRPERGLKGCGASITFYKTYPNEKRMPFSGEAQVVPGTEAWVGNGLVASVSTANVHFVDCPHYQSARKPSTPRDGKAAGAGRS